MLTQPRLGVSSTTPLLVSSGPGAPTPTPAISAPGTSFRGLGDRPLCESHETIDDGRGAGLGVRRLGAEGAECAAVLGDAPDHEVGPADVNAQYESHAAPPRQYIPLTAAATRSTDNSIMQR